jgi:hypothetical protein
MQSIRPTKIQQEMNIIRDMENFLMHGGVVTVCKPKVPRKYKFQGLSLTSKIVRV